MIKDESLEPTLAADPPQPRVIERLSLPALGPAEERYELVGLLGEGGMGEVHLGLDRRLGRDVAYKVTKQRAAQTSTSRFLREAMLSARLEHPSIVPVYDIGTREDGTTFFTMRRIRGQTLERVIDDMRGGHSSYTRHRLLGAFVQLCLAIDYAHARGVVHRDLKPANVIFGDFGEVYVLDWGIAKIAGETDAIVDRPSAEEGTMDGLMMGTLGYMPPEQFRGEHATLDGRADVYSLGAILFEILALERMRGGASFLELRRAMEEPIPAHPAERAPDRDVPPELDAVCAKATDPDREARYTSARALAEAVERFLEGDRDAALRRRTAQEHAERARRAWSDDPEARVEAGRQATRALAFDPTNAEAAAMQREQQATLNIWYARGLAGVCASFGLVLLVSGVRDWPLLAAMLATGFGSVACFYAAGRIATYASLLQTIAIVLIGATNVLLTRWLGPWIVVPAAMFVNTLASTMFGSRRDRTIRSAIGVAVVVLPVVLEELGTLDPSYATHLDQLIIYAHLADFTPWLPWLLTAVTVFPLLTAAVWLSILMDRVAALELRLHTQAWVLRRVVS